MSKGSLLVVGLLAFAAGLAVGAVLGITLSDGSGTELPAAPDADKVADLQRKIGDLELALVAAQAKGPTDGGARSTQNPSSPPDTSDLDPSVLADRAEAIRRAALNRAENAERIAAASLEYEARREQTRKAAEQAYREELERGGTMAFLKKLDKEWLPPWDTVTSAESFAGLFKRAGGAATLNGDSLRREEPPPDGTTIYFPAGRHLLEYRTLLAWRPFPRDLLFQGQGMDQTLIVLDSELTSQGQVENLHFADLTLHANDNYLVEFRAPFSLRLDRCRVVGFDIAAGASCMVAGDPCAFYAMDCLIEAGYGRSPGSGCLFDVRGALVSRMERCVIRGPFSSVFGGGSDGAEVYVGCSFEDMNSTLQPRFENPGRDVKLIDCTVTYRPEGALRPEQRSLKEISPDWESEKERRSREHEEEKLRLQMEKERRRAEKR